MKTQLFDKLYQIGEILDPKHLKQAERLQEDVWRFSHVERIPVILPKENLPDYQLFPYKEAFEDPCKMLWNELFHSYLGAKIKDDRVFTVRANYGPAIVPSLFGLKYNVDNATTWIKGLNDSKAIHELIDKGIPYIKSGLGARVLETQAIYREYLHESGLSPYIHQFQADSQGPFDCAYLMWGENIFYAMYDEPELVHKLLDLITETIVIFIKEQKTVLCEAENEMYHWWWKIPGGARVVDDATINLSPKLYEEFSKPYTERVYEAFGGGYMHYCGHGLQNQSLRTATKGLKGIEMAGKDTADTIQGYDYDLQKIWDEASINKVAILFADTTLPSKRPDISTGLIYADTNIQGRTIDEAIEYLKILREFWFNKE